MGYISGRSRLRSTFSVLICLCVILVHASRRIYIHMYTLLKHAAPGGGTLDRNRRVLVVAELPDARRQLLHEPPLAGTRRDRAPCLQGRAGSWVSRIQRILRCLQGYWQGLVGGLISMGMKTRSYACTCMHVYRYIHGIRTPVHI